MPRIDPLQLLKCLSVLLSPEGGILSRDEVPRLVNLMTKFSKKLVSKCVYILILKNSEKSLLNSFMAEGGWHLIYRWLEDAVSIGNFNLVSEILTLLLITPVDVERLKMNNISKLVKNLSRREDLGGVYELSVRLVEDWLKIAKGVARVETITIRTGPAVDEITSNNNINNNNNTIETVQMDEIKDNQTLSTVDGAQIVETPNNKLVKDKTISPITFYKITDRDGKQVISKVDDIVTDPSISEIVVVAEIDSKKDEKTSKSSSGDSKSKSRSHSSSSKSRSSSSSSSGNKSKSSSSDKHRSSSSSKSRDRDREKDRKDRDKYKDRHKSTSSKSSSSSSNSSSNKNKGEIKEKQAEKDKDTLAKIKPQSIDKLGRIPKKSVTSSSDEKTNNSSEVNKKKPTMSIEVRKSNSTVKVYQSKMRSTGLEEEVKPPGPRPIKKPSSTSSTTLPPIPPPTKRMSPIKDLPTPPEKKLKIELPERPGAIKLIPPKPKPPVLQESDIFMDALTASATTKKEPKRRKRRLSATKDTPESPTTTPSTQDNSQASIASPLGLKNIAAPNFYQDTLVETDDKSNDNNNEIKSDNDNNPSTPTDNSLDINDIRPLSDGNLKGILVDPKRKKAQKKTIKWRADNDLVEVRFFDLDENERVNVSRNFMDMAKMEMSSEREALLLCRKVPNEDLMEPQMPWKTLYPIDYNETLDVIPGRNSKEKGIQYAREIVVLQALYFDKRKIPDSPEEPMPENHQMIDPIVIPLEDRDSQEIDLMNTPWPEPKGSPPPPIDNKLPHQQLFQNIQVPFQNFQQLPPPNFQGMPPRFALPNNQPAGMFGGPNMMQNGGNMMGPPPPPELLHQAGLNSSLFGPGPPDNFNPMGGGMNENFQMPFNPPPPNMNMFPQNNFNMNRGGGGGGRGGFRRGGGNNNNNNNSGGGWVRLNGTGNWNRGGGGGGGGGGPRGGRLCKNIKIHGFCRNMDNCPFIHPS